MPEIILIAHNIRSTHNVGAIFRTAEGFGVKRIIISGYTPYPTYKGDMRIPHLAQKITSQIHKTALGAETLVPFEYYEQLDDWLSKNTDSPNPLPIIALEQTDNSQLIQNYTPPNEFALLLGEEVSGIQSSHLDICDTVIEIPMYGQKESYNVSVACGIALYALRFNNNTLMANHVNQSI